MAIGGWNNYRQPDYNTGRIPPNPALPAGFGGGGRFDPEKLQTLAPAISILIAALASGKGYRGIGAGSAAETSNLLAQQEEERKRQAWLDEITKARWEREQEVLAGQKRVADVLTGKLGKMGEDIPGTEGIPAREYAWNRPGYGMHVTPEDRTAYEAAKAAGTMAADQPAIPGTPGTPGDVDAKLIAELITQSGGADWAVNMGLQYLMAPKTAPLDWSEYHSRLSPKNPYSTLPPQALSDPAIRKAAEDIENGLRPPTEKDLLDIELTKARIGQAKRSNQPQLKPEDTAKAKAEKQKSNYEALSSIFGQYRTPSIDAVADLNRYRGQLINIIGVDYFNKLLQAAKAYNGPGAQFKPGQGSPIRRALQAVGAL